MERIRDALPPRVGVFGVGLAAYWDQFEGLLDALRGFQAHVEDQIRTAGAEVVSAGLVDTPERAREAGDLLRGVDLLVCYAGTYATSSQVLPVVQRAGARVIVLNLQPVSALDYGSTGTGKWLEACSACCVPEISNALARSRIPFRSVSGLLFEDAGPAGERAWSQIREWVRASGAARSIQRARVGFLGHTYPGMLDMYSDFTQHHAQLGLHVEVLEVDDLLARVPDANALDVKLKREEILDTFVLADPSSDPIAAAIGDDDIEWSSRVAVGLDRLVADFNLDGLTYYHRGLDNESERVIAGMIPGLTLLTGKGVPCAGEGDLKTCVGMFLVDRIGAGGSYTELYAMDFDDDVVLMGHDGPAHIAISDEAPTLRKLKLYHGKSGFGVSTQMRVQLGPVTILGVTQTADGRLKFLGAQGESVAGPTLAIGNTNSRIRFALEPDRFVDAWCAHGPTHHVALGVGHIEPTLTKVADLLDVEYVRVN